MALKIYTKTGDDGTTSLFGGKRVPKNHERIEAYGTLDELSSWLGLIVDELGSISQEHRQLLRQVQEELFVIGSWLAAEGVKNLSLPKIHVELIREIEQAIDKMETSLPPLKNFILPGGHALVSKIHITRTVCRRGERRVVAISEHLEHISYFIEFLNRLSDYLFVLSRFVGQLLQAHEIPWTPKT